MLVRVMKSVGHVCDEAADGAQAVAMVQQAMRVWGTGTGVGAGTEEEAAALTATDAVTTTATTTAIGSSSVSSSGSASASACTYGYDAVLMDSVMPVLDGPAATVRLRQLGYRGKVFGVTGSAMPSDIAHFVASGADEVCGSHRRGSHAHLPTANHTSDCPFSSDMPLVV